MIKTVSFLLSILLLSFNVNANNSLETNFKSSATIEKSCTISAVSGGFGEIDYFDPNYTYNSHDHIRDVYATTPITILCTPGTVFNFKGTPQNTSNKNGYMLQHVNSPEHYIVVNPYFDLSPKESEPVFSQLFRGQSNRYITASGNKEDWTMYWFAFNYLTNRFKDIPAPIHGDYVLNMTITLDY